MESGADLAHSADSAVSELLESLLGCPGVETIDRLAALDPQQLGDWDRVTYLRAWEQQQAWVSAQVQQARVAVAGAEPRGRDDFAREEVRLALRLSAGAAARRIDTARALVGTLPDTLIALSEGRISYLPAEVIAKGVERLGPDGSAAVEELVLPRAEDQTVADLRRAVRRVVAVVDPMGVEAAHAQAVQQRLVELYDDEDGMATLVARMAAPDACTVFTAIDALAHRSDSGEDLSAPESFPRMLPWASVPGGQTRCCAWRGPC